MEKSMRSKITSREFLQKPLWSALDWFIAMPGTIIRIIANLF
ncbi:hypothetical protein ACE3NQ_23330 [Paenibacillus terreus]|uniref:Uncharacterized protein n=1 Tax=Paenibacillus terreus TaxID=1387834 RepID=A0ABV5BDT2_9BACL